MIYNLLYETKSGRCKTHISKLEVFLWLTVNCIEDSHDEFLVNFYEHGDFSFLEIRKQQSWEFHQYSFLCTFMLVFFMFLSLIFIFKTPQILEPLFCIYFDQWPKFNIYALYISVNEILMTFNMFQSFNFSSKVRLIASLKQGSKLPHKFYFCVREAGFIYSTNFSELKGPKTREESWLMLFLVTEVHL